MTSLPWRVVIGRLGRLGHGELKGEKLLRRFVPETKGQGCTSAIGRTEGENCAAARKVQQVIFPRCFKYTESQWFLNSSLVTKPFTLRKSRKSFISIKVILSTLEFLTFFTY